MVDIDNISDLEKLGKVADVVIDFSNPAALPAVAAYVRRTGHRPSLRHHRLHRL